jgi:NADPH:quinone reductase-like Zn-dependent oxidoreductase
MKAAVVTTFGQAPHYADAPEPRANGGDEAVVEVLAAALSPRVRSQAAGTHYTSDDQLPLIPGIDGVGRLPGGELVYFVLPDTNAGAMAERTVVDLRRVVPLPRNADPIRIAAVMNPAMASWVALRRRVRFRRGQGVLILGATGNAGRCAVQVAGRLGAGRIIAAGRGVERLRDLPVLGATRTVDLGEGPEAVGRQLADAGKDVDVVLDFLWGEPTRAALYAIIPNRTREGQLLSWVQIGSVAGLEAPIPSAALRAVNLRIVGSGQGSVAPRTYRSEIGKLAKEVLRGTFDAPVREVRLSDVEAAWGESGGTERVVIVP